MNLISIYSKITDKDFAVSEKEIREALAIAIQSKIQETKDLLKTLSHNGEVVLENKHQTMVVSLDDALIEVVRAFQSLAKQGFEKIVLDQECFMEAFANAMNFKAINGLTIDNEGKKQQACLSSTLIDSIVKDLQFSKVKKAIIVFKDINKVFDINNQVKKSTRVVFSIIELDKDNNVVYDSNLDKIIPHYNRKNWSEDKRKVLYTLIPNSK